MRDHIIKNSTLCLDSSYSDGSYQIRTAHEGTLSLATGHGVHLAMNSQYVATHAPLRTHTGGTYLHDTNLHVFPQLAMGYAHATKADTFGPGLVPAGAAHTDEDPHLFLGKNGLWGLPSEHTGAVYETFSSLADTPNNYTHAAGKYLKMGDENKIEFTDLATDVAALDLTSLTTRSLSVTSDVRSKKCIEAYDVQDSVDIVNKLDMVAFKYREGDARPKLGVIAQNVEAHFPQAVSQGRTYKQVDYTQIIGLLLANVKALNDKLEMLDAQTRADT
jgi:hypothetical protein